ncbi:HAD family hydrolase [Streptomyces sp. NPDC002671]
MVHRARRTAGTRLAAGTSRRARAAGRGGRAHQPATAAERTPPAAITATLDLLEQARARRIPRAVASSAASVLVHSGIERLGLDRLLPVVATGESVTRGKPAPNVYLEAARQLCVAPSRCLAVDDAPDGIAAARSASMRLLTVRGTTLVPVPQG